MTAMLETAPAVAPVVVTTLDGESRAAECDSDGNWSCPFCSGANFPGAVWYERRGWSAPCANPMCVVGGAMTATGTARYRESERRAREDGERRERWQRAQDERKAAEKAAQAAADAKRARLEVQRRDTSETARQLSFGWHCFAGDCEASGWSREEYDAHMRSHGRKSITAPKLTKLRRKAPAATLAKLDFDAPAFITWTQSHTAPATCKSCGHSQRDHRERSVSYGGDVTAAGCAQCDCRGSICGYESGVTTYSERRGQFWALGPDAHSAWFLPDSAAPWETRRPEAVLLYHVAGGRWETSAYSAKFARKYAA